MCVYVCVRACARLNPHDLLLNEPLFLYNMNVELVIILRLLLCKQTTARSRVAGRCVAVEPGSEIIRDVIMSTTLQYQTG